MDAGLKIQVGADVSDAIANIGKLDDTVESLEKQLALLGNSIDHALDAGRDSTGLEDEFQRISDKLKALRAQVAQPIVPAPAPPMPVPDDKPLLDSISKQRIAFTDLGRIITGQGFSLRALASNFALLGPGVTIAVAALYGLYEILSKQTDQEKKAEEQAKKLHDTLLNLKSASEVTDSSTGSESGNIARVQALAAAIQDTNNTYKERQNALNELRETNKAYFGDLTLEASSLATLSDKVKEYSQALITEAIVKGQVEEIAKVSSELENQVRVLNTLKDARDRANAEAAKPQASSAGNVAGGGADVLNNPALRAADQAEDAFKAQQTAVDKLRTSIAGYTGELNKAIAEQIQFKPLQVPPKYTDDLKGIIPILQQIKTIYDDLAKANKEPLFKQVVPSADNKDAIPKNQANAFQAQADLIQTQIKEAIKKGITDGANDTAVKKAYDSLVVALQAKLANLNNPNLSAHIDFSLANVTADPLAQIESKIEKSIGSKGLEIKVPATLKLDLANSGYSKEEQQILLKKAEDDALRGLPTIKWTPAIQVLVNQKNISDALSKQLKQSLNSVIGKDITSGLTNLGDSIGKAIATGTNPIEAAGKSILSSLGTLIQDIGKNLIEYGIVKEGFDDVLTAGIALPGVAAIAIGVAAEAIGALVKNTGSSYKAFATGGIVTGPTMGLVGEAGPEVIFPLSQLNRFVKNTQGSGTQNINVTGQLAGNNIRLALARTNKQQALV